MNWAWLVFPSFIILAVVITPLSGAAVRLIAHYKPNPRKSIDTEAQGFGDAQSTNIPDMSSVFRRVRQLEGWPGIYKGFLSNLYASILLSCIFTYYLNQLDLPGIELFFFGLLFVIVNIPIEVLGHRAIVTPYKLSYTKPVTGLRILLTPTERNKPWKLYLLPGIFVTYAMAYFFLVLPLVPSILSLYSLYAPKPEIVAKTVEYFKSQGVLFKCVVVAIGSIFYLLLLLSFAWLSMRVLPALRVASIRLSIQRCHDDDDSSEAVEAEVYGVERYSDEDVITLREGPQYYGLQHCLRTITIEEVGSRGCRASQRARYFWS